MRIEELISPSTLTENNDTTSKINLEELAIDWLEDWLWSLAETRDLKEVRERCITAKIPLLLYLDQKPIFFSQKAEKQWSDWSKRKLPCPPKTYWEDEDGNLIYFSPGQELEIHVEFPVLKEIVRYRLIEEVAYSSWEIKLIGESPWK
jgi:hypothetical protein